MNKPKIVAYLKPTCGWSQGVRAVMRKYDLPYEDRDIINDPRQREEMIQKSGQMLSPCVEINGQMLPDISGEEVEAWMLPPTSLARTKCRRPRRCISRSDGSRFSLARLFARPPTRALI
jgi:monothiol glutaredoxin